MRAWTFALVALVVACAGGSATPPSAPTQTVDVTPAVGAPVAVAADAGASSPPVLGEVDPAPPAVVLFHEGTEAYDRSDYARALDRFQGAYRADPRPPLLYDIGMCLERLGRSGEAADVYESYVRASAGMTHVDRMSMELRIKKLRAQP